MNSSNELKHSDKIWTDALFLSAIFLLTAGWNLSLQQIAAPDEPRYASPARELVEGTGKWGVPMFNGAPRLKKPLLIYWILALAGKAGSLLGITYVTVFRLVSISFGLLTILCTYGTSRILFSRYTGLIAGLILTTTFYFHEITRQILIDPMLAGFIALSWFCFTIAFARLKSDKTQTPVLPLLGYYLAMGLACEAKGPALVTAYVILPILIFVWLERHRILPENEHFTWLIKRSGLLWGLPLFIVVGFAWCAVFLLEGHGKELKEFFLIENLQRALGGLDHNDGNRKLPFVYYFQDIPSKFVPWVLLWIPAIWWSVKQRKPRNWQAKLLLLGIVVPFVIMGLAGSKRSLYVLPLYSFLSIWTAWSWECILIEENPGWLPRVLNLCLQLIAGTVLVAGIAIIGGSVAFLLHKLPSKAADLMSLTNGEVIFSIIIGLSLIVMSVIYFKSSSISEIQWRSSLWIPLMVATLALTFEAFGRPILERKSDPQFTYAIIKHNVDDHPLIWLGGHNQECIWYLRRAVPRVNSFSELKDTFYDVQDTILAVREREFNDMPELKNTTIELARIQDGKELRYLLKPDPLHKPRPELFHSVAKVSKISPDED